MNTELESLKFVIAMRKQSIATHRREIRKTQTKLENLELRLARANSSHRQLKYLEAARLLLEQNYSLADVARKVQICPSHVKNMICKELRRRNRQLWDARPQIQYNWEHGMPVRVAGSEVTWSEVLVFLREHAKAFVR